LKICAAISYEFLIIELIAAVSLPQLSFASGELIKSGVHYRTLWQQLITEARSYVVLSM